MSGFPPGSPRIENGTLDGENAVESGEQDGGAGWTILWFEAKPRRLRFVAAHPFR
jgi:hypothetical protein